MDARLVPMQNEDSHTDRLEKELNLKTLQIRSLLAITQAINENVSARGLYDMYRSFLNWEMGVGKMALVVRKGEDWECASTIHIDYNLERPEYIQYLLKIKRLHSVQNKDPQFLHPFDIVVPVYHKEEPITFALIGQFEGEEDMYSKIQFITTITNVIAVAIENKRLFNRQLEQERLKKEMELAQEVQQMLIPEEFPSGEGFDVAAIYKPHFNVGGDYIDFFHLEDGEYLLCIGDVSGKGVSAAMLVANFQAIIKSLIPRFNELEELVRVLNESIFAITKGDRFITFFIAYVNTKEGVMKYVNAGHNPPLLFVDDEPEARALMAEATVLGAVRELPESKQIDVPFERDILLLTYTDGLTDIHNHMGEPFSLENVQEFATEHRYLSPGKFNGALTKRIQTYTGSSDFPDDIAVMCCKVRRWSPGE